MQHFRRAMLMTAAIVAIINNSALSYAERQSQIMAMLEYRSRGKGGGKRTRITKDVLSRNSVGRSAKRDFSKVKQTVQQKQVALAQAEAKRESKRAKRLNVYNGSFFNSYQSERPHWQQAA